MRLTQARMYDRFAAGDRAFNGHFFTAVKTTGIYCLPSCKARKPKVENVQFFPSCEAARLAGFRACKKCHPDDFARGADPVLETIESVVAEIRTAPGTFADAKAITRRSGFGTTRVFELFREHYHTTPADLLLRARLSAARGLLLKGGHSLAEIAGEVGFASLSVFHEHFRKTTGMTPAGYRKLSDELAFSVDLPAGYPLPYLRRALSRDPHSATEHLNGDHYVTAVRLGTVPAKLTLKLGTSKVEVRVEPRGLRSEEDLPQGAAAHAIAAGILGLDQDAAGFSRLCSRLGLARLVAGRRELRIIQTPSVFDGLLWSIIGQQINFPFACILKSRLVQGSGTPMGGTGGIGGRELFAPPLPHDVAHLTMDQLRTWQFSRPKAEYVLSTAKQIADGKLDIEALRLMSTTRAERTLLEVRGLGPWSVNYLMMRALGFSDCVPLGDTGVTSGLKSLFKLEERPDVDATRRLMTVFSPYRSLATTHIWQFDRPIP